MGPFCLCPPGVGPFGQALDKASLAWGKIVLHLLLETPPGLGFPGVGPFGSGFPGVVSFRSCPPGVGLFG